MIMWHWRLEQWLQKIFVSLTDNEGFTKSYEKIIIVNVYEIIINTPILGSARFFIIMLSRAAFVWVYCEIYNLKQLFSIVKYFTNVEITH